MILKICGMKRQADLDAAREAGFDFCGFIFHQQSPRYIDAASAARFETGAMKRVGVFVDSTPSEILEIMKIADLDFAQLHGNQGEEVAKALGWEKVIRVIWPNRYKNMTEAAREMSGHKCAMFLLDAGQRGGGSGKNLDWQGLAELHIAESWLLAGGLNEANLQEALKLCNPSGLDFNSGLEISPGIKDHVKLFAASRAARKEGIQ